ncbi:D-amino-acid transaminase, partial [Listeria monocytogenes]|nr:D-amino-acid transaminase [Listeria monocytogenes]
LILNGITRQVIIDVAKKNGIPVKEADFTLTDLREADEVFISSTTIEITPITHIDGVQVADGKRGPITAQLHQYFVEEITRACGELVFAK